jgi:hypothetical protein
VDFFCCHSGREFPTELKPLARLSVERCREANWKIRVRGKNVVVRLGR